MGLKALRAVLGRNARKAAKAVGMRTSGPTRVLCGMPAGARMVDGERKKSASRSFPVLPHGHPLLETCSLSYRSAWVLPCLGLKVFGPSVAVVDSEQNLLADASVEWGRSAKENWTFRRLSLPRTEVLEGKTLVLASTGGETYFHWMTDVLPRLRLIQEAGFKPAAFNHILVNGTDKPFQKETLEILGLPLSLCRPFPKNKTAYLCEEAVLPSLPGVSGVVPPETIQFLRKSFAQLVPAEDRKLFLGRGGARHRGLVEEAGIGKAVQKRGFQAIECSSLTVRQQAELFSSASVVVVAHGAAATNLAFCRPGTRVLELFGPEYVNPCYRDLCVAAGLEHSAVIGNGKDWQLYLPHDRPSAPITASRSLVEKVLDEWGC